MDKWQSLGLIVVSALLLVYLLVKLFHYATATEAHSKWLASFCDGFNKEFYNKAMFSRKKQLFSKLADGLESVPGDILEVGAGPGANLEFLPSRCSMIVAEPSEHMEKIFRENLKKYEGFQLKKYVKTFGEDLGEIPDGSVAAVVCTLVLCSVNDVDQVLREIKRVLKPGGRLYFMEHVADKPGTWLRTFQHVTMVTGLMWRLLGHCSCDMETWKFINKAGFSRVVYDKFYAPFGRRKINPLNLLLMPHISGYAEV